MVAAARFEPLTSRSPACSGWCNRLIVGSAHAVTAVDRVLIALHTPIALALAAVCGYAGAHVAAMTKVWDKHWKRVAIVAVQGFFFSFGAKTLEREWYENDGCGMDAEELEEATSFDAGGQKGRKFPRFPLSFLCNAHPLSARGRAVAGWQTDRQTDRQLSVCLRGGRQLRAASHRLHGWCGGDARSATNRP